MPNLILNAALRAEAHDIGRTLGEFCLNILHRAVTPHGIFAVIAEILLVGLLLRVRRCEFLLRAEARIGHAALHQTLDKGLVNFRALTLTVRTVCTVVALKRCALVKIQTERTEHLDDSAHAALDLALFIGILNAQIEHAARLVRQTLVHQRAVQVTQMHKARRAWPHTGHLCALRQRTFGIARLDVLRCGVDMREQQFRQTVIIHFVHSNFLDGHFRP